MSVSEKWWPNGVVRPGRDRNRKNAELYQQGDVSSAFLELVLFEFETICTVFDALPALVLKQDPSKYEAYRTRASPGRRHKDCILSTVAEWGSCPRMVVQWKDTHGSKLVPKSVSVQPLLSSLGAFLNKSVLIAGQAAPTALLPVCEDQGVLMGAVLHIAGIDATAIRHDYLALKIILVNVGSERVGPGNVLARQTCTDGSVQPVEFFSMIDLSPGETTKVSQLLRGAIKEVDFRSYRPHDGSRGSIPLAGTFKRGHFFWPFERAS
jgi:hypothetical protein